MVAAAALAQGRARSAYSPADLWRDLLRADLGMCPMGTPSRVPMVFADVPSPATSRELEGLKEPSVLQLGATPAYCGVEPVGREDHEAVESVLQRDLC